MSETKELQEIVAKLAVVERRSRVAMRMAVGSVVSFLYVAFIWLTSGERDLKASSVYAREVHVLSEDGQDAVVIGGRAPSRAEIVLMSNGSERVLIRSSRSGGELVITGTEGSAEADVRISGRNDSLGSIKVRTLEGVREFPDGE